ncbi:MAG: 3'-5' exonuclease, partial [Pseudomonadota bacterium]
VSRPPSLRREGVRDRESQVARRSNVRPPSYRWAMSKSYLVLDIETIPDPDLFECHAAEGAADRPFPPLYAHRPIVIGALWLDDACQFKRLGLVGEGKNEKDLLEDFSSFVGRHRPDLITFNGRAFDLPVLLLRSLRHGVQMPWYYQGRLRNRYSEEGHVDLCDLLSDHGAARPISLDAASRLIGLPGKLGVDGSQVESLFKAGNLDAIKSYCLADVAQTALVFLRFRLLQGVLQPQAFRVAASGLVEALRADKRLASFVEALDCARLLAVNEAESTPGPCLGSRPSS